MNSKGLDHVAIAVRDLDAAIALYRDALGLTLAHVEVVETEGVRVAIFGSGTGRIELMEPTRPDSAVARFLDRKGEGLHHICVEVEEIEAAMEALKQRGAPLLDEVPRAGSGGARVCFVHPRGARGVLVELRQGP